jgi:transcriptional regulator with XRE-family HTH domain
MFDEALRTAELRRRLPPPAQRRLLRLRAGISIRAVAQRVGVSDVTVLRYETGARNPRDPAILARYLETLGILEAHATR